MSFLFDLIEVVVFKRTDWKNAVLVKYRIIR